MNYSLDCYTRILDRLHNDYELLESKGYEVFGVYLQGSQNYHLAYENSDIDTKAIVLPSFDDIVFNRQPISTTLILETNEHLDVKDIRLMFQNFKKQNINFLEILFTEYYVVNPKYSDLAEYLRKNAERIAHYNPRQAVKTMKGMAMEKFKALEHPYPTLLDKIEKWGYDPKQLSHLVRLLDFVPRYIEGAPYASCLIPKNKKRILEIKKNDPLIPLEEARIIARETLSAIDEVANKFIDAFPDECDPYVEDVLNAIIREALRRFWRIEEE